MKNNILKEHQNDSTRPGQTTGVRNAVCLCTDRRMLIPALFVASAVKSHAAISANRLDIIIVAQSSDVTDVHRRWMENQGILLCDDMDVSGIRDICPFQKRLSPATLMKLMLAEHFAGCYDKILYLDCDLTIHDDISPIFSLDITPFALAAVPAGRIWTGFSDKMRTGFEDHCEKMGMTKPYRFFNSGVLYIDVAMWNKEKVGEKALDFIRQKPELCSLPDENALNAILDGNIAQLSSIWNAPPHSQWRRKDTAGIYLPVIVHYTGEVKPWRRFCRGRRIFKDREGYKLYKNFLKGTPWPGWLNEQWTWRDLYRNIKGEIGLVLRRLGLRGHWEGPSAGQRCAYQKEARKFYESERFVDFEQNIVIRENGKLRLKTKMPDG
jgi:lipopolysaccharide biosynthesis glycosyltransferase